MQHPLAHRETDAAGLRDTAEKAAGDIIIRYPRQRPDHRPRIRGKRNRAVDDTLDPGIVERRHAMKHAGDTAFEAFEIVLEQFHAEIPRRRLIVPGRAAILLPGSEQ